MESSSEVNPEGMKRFVRHLCLIGQRHEQREKSQKNLGNQFKKVKQVTLTQKPRKWVIEKEFKELEKKMTIALKNERMLIGMREADSNLLRQLKDNIFSLEYQLKENKELRNLEEDKNKEKISDIANSVSNLREKINSLVEREERIKELEKKVKRS